MRKIFTHDLQVNWNSFKSDIPRDPHRFNHIMDKRPDYFGITAMVFLSIAAILLFVQLIMQLM